MALQMIYLVKLSKYILRKSNRKFIGLLTWRIWLTKAKRIAEIALNTNTLGRMGPHRTVSIDTTCPRARVPTFLVHAGEMIGTVWVRRALGPAVRWRSDEWGQARTLRGASRGYSTLGVGTTWGWHTWVDGFCLNSLHGRC